MKKIYISYDAVGDEIIDAFVRKNNEAAKRDFIQAFKKQARDDSEIKLFEVVIHDDEQGERLEGIPVHQIWSSTELEEPDKDD